MKVVTLTLNPAIDATAHTKNVVPERKLRCSRPRHEPGGGGVNVARVVKRLGEDVCAVYVEGGHNGRRLTELLQAEDISLEAVSVKGQTRTNLTVTEETSERQYRFVMPGTELTRADCQKVRQSLDQLCEKGDWLVLSGSLPGGVDIGFYAELAAMVKAGGSKVVIDTTGPPLARALEEGVYLFKPNLRELELLVDADIDTDREIVEAARELIGRASKAALVSLGAGGALLVTATEAIHYRTPTVRIRSKVGAGDSMVAGMVTALSRGENLDRAARWGVAAGAAAVMTPGSELCRKEDVERLVAQISGHQSPDETGQSTETGTSKKKRATH